MYLAFSTVGIVTCRKLSCMVMRNANNYGILKMVSTSEALLEFHGIIELM